MPDNSKEIERSKVPAIIKKLADAVSTNMNDLYSKTYFTSPSNKNDLMSTKYKINKTIDDIISNNMELVGIPNITSLFNRLDAIQKDPISNKKIVDMFSDRQLMDGLISTYVQNKYMRDYDNEIDTVLKYCPKLAEALEVRKDNVLSADHFSKNFIDVSDDMNVQDDVVFMKRCTDIKDIYDLSEKVEDWYIKAATYGEVFVYIVPYHKAIARLLANKNNLVTSQSPIQESTISINNTTPIFESIKNEYFSSGKELNIKVEFNMTGMLIDTIKDRYKAINESERLHEQALQEALAPNTITSIYSKKSATGGSSIKRDHAKEVSKDNKLEIDKGIINKDKEDQLDYSDFEKRLFNIKK